MTRKTHFDVDEEPTTDDDADLESLLRKVANGEDFERPHLPTEGTVIGEKYRLLSRIGRGGMGAVFSAEHVVSEKRVALKWTLRSTADERTRQRFLREARAAGRCHHPNVVDVYDVGEAGGGGYLVMELLHGETLRQRMDRAPIEVEEAIDLLAPAIRGVAAVHQAGVIHRDLKPENIFLCHDAEGALQGVKVLDFGISAMSSFDPHSATLTNDGTVAGTPAYIAPERFERVNNIDERTDVYSLGVILYEMLSGRRPFEADSYPALILAVTREKPKPPSSLRANLPRKLDNVVLRALAKQPEHRYASALALLDALLPYSKTAQRARPPRWIGRAAGLTLALGASALLLWFVSRDAPPEKPVTQAAASARYLAGAACSACLAEHCAGPQATCSADAECSAIIAAARNSVGPPIADRRYLGLLFDHRWNMDRAPTGTKSSRDGLTRCARQHCLAACGIGRNFACVDQFEWPASFPERADVRVRLVPQEGVGSALEGWRIRACALGSQCEPVMGSAITDKAGFATVPLDFSNVRPNARQLPEFDGWLELDGGEGFYPQHARQTMPFVSGFYKRMAISGREQLRVSHAARRLPLPDEARGLLQVQALDCEMWGAWGLSLELWQYNQTAYTPCTDCVVAYPDQSGVPDATLHEFKAWNVSEAEVALPARDFALVLRDTETRRIVSGMPHLEVRAGAATAVVLAPLSKEQLAAMPKQIANAH